MERSISDSDWVQRALTNARQTKLLRLEPGLRHRVAEPFEQLFGSQTAQIIADSNTFEAAGQDVLDGLRSAGHCCVEPFVFDESPLLAASSKVEVIRQVFSRNDAIPVAVGSGTINDLTKLASHQLERPYLVVATAASMDGYSAWGASITHDGSKQTFQCPAPAAILVDMDVIEAAPTHMTAAGYADLMAKIVASADWIVADALGVEPIDRTAWCLIHDRLREWLAEPEKIRRHDAQALESLMLGLLLSGFAMQHTGTSRPASGAEHQFSHLWDMQQLVHHGQAPSHGFKVGIGTLASSAMYEQLLLQPFEQVDAFVWASRWNDLSAQEADIRRRFDAAALRDKALEETRAKYVSAEQLRRRLERLRAVWPLLRRRLQSQLIPYGELQDRLRAAGCPDEPEQIGIDKPRLYSSYIEAYYIRRRFTVLDLAMQTGQLQLMLADVFGPRGRFSFSGPTCIAERG